MNKVPVAEACNS